MNSYTNKKFWELFYALPLEIRQQALQAFAQFAQDPFYPRLQFKEVNKKTGLWSARINNDYRVLGHRIGSSVRWFWIGNHADYEKLIPKG